MKILEKEIQLREETRALEQARPGLESEVYAEQSTPLADLQEELADRTEIVIDKIHELPDGASKFSKEIALLSRANEVMWEAHTLLIRPETGRETIAAETEVIELLLQAKRSKGGGGGGSTPGGGQRFGKDSGLAALALIGESKEAQAKKVERDVAQSTGVSGKEFPEEFRSGLDAYFGKLESLGRGLAKPAELEKP